MDLVTPASKVAESVNGEPDVCLEGQSVDSTRVHTLQSGQLLLVVLHQVCQSVEEGRGERMGGKEEDGRERGG